MKDEKLHRNYLSSTLGCYCPRCREGKLFRHSTSVNVRKNMDMYEHCPVCRQPTDIEVGFYYGTSYISYLVCIFITVVYFLLWWLIIGFSFTDKRFLVWIISDSVLLLILQPWLMRLSRSLWISFFVHYDPDWKTHPPAVLERINKDEMNNW